MNFYETMACGASGKETALQKSEQSRATESPIVTTPNPQKSAFECACQNMKALLRYFKAELQMPTDTIKLMIAGMLHSLDVEDLTRRENMTPEPEKPA